MNDNHIQAGPRIAIILSELRPGGMERLVVHLSNGLKSRNIPVKIICLQGKGDLAGKIENHEIIVSEIGSYGSKDVKAIWSLGRILREFRASIVNIHDYSSLPYGVLANFLFLRCPLMFTAHGLLYEGFDELRKRYRFFAKFLSCFSAVSEAVANRHRDYLDWKKDILVIPNGVPEIETDNSHRRMVRNELRIEDGQLLFLAVGNPRPEKGFEDLIQAVIKLKLMTDGKFRFKVAVAGKLDDSEYCQMLKTSVESEKLQDYFMFLGFRDDTAALYNAADIFVLSSRSEGLPMVILEAMTAELPIIATRVGGIPDAIGQVALLVDPQEPQKLATAMYDMMTDISSRDLFVRKGKELVREKYSMEKMVDAYIQVYEELVNSQ